MGERSLPASGQPAIRLAGSGRGRSPGRSRAGGMQRGVRSGPPCQDGFVLQNTSCAFPVPSPVLAVPRRWAKSGEPRAGSVSVCACRRGRAGGGCFATSRNVRYPPAPMGFLVGADSPHRRGRKKAQMDQPQRTIHGRGFPHPALALRDHRPLGTLQSAHAMVKAGLSWRLKSAEDGRTLHRTCFISNLTPALAFALYLIGCQLQQPSRERQQALRLSF